MAVRKKKKQSYRDAVLALAPSSYWPLDEAGGTVARDVMGVANGTHTNSTPGSPGVPGDGSKAADYNGTTGLTTFGDRYDFPNNDPFTVSIWVYVDALTGGAFPRAVSKDGANPCWRMLLNGTTGALSFTRVDSGAGADSGTGPSAVTVGSWHFLCGTYDGVSLRAYRNGISGTPVASSRSLGSGNTSNLTISPAHGLLDCRASRLAIWSGRALSAGEIANLYSIGRG